MSSDLPESIGPYRVRELLGKAGQAAVYAAVDGANRTVAVKLFSSRLAEDAAALERFRREVAAVVPVSRHPHLVRVLETGAEGGQPYVVMELVAGTSLDRALKARPVSLTEAFTVMRGICRGLAQAHRHGLVHRSLTPRNVLVSSDFATVKVADFGVTGFETMVQSLTATLGTGEIRLGALYYLAPETLEGGGVDARADLYSAGVIFHQLLTGRAPGPRFALPSQLVPALSPEIDAVVLKCLARRPDERYADTGEVLAALDRLEESLRLRAFSEIREAGSLLREGTRAAGGTRTLLYAGLALLAIVLAAIGYLVLR
jgi:eukaryotic-like serine/threonine-protein kinase